MSSIVVSYEKGISLKMKHFFLVLGLLLLQSFLIPNAHGQCYQNGILCDQVSMTSDLTTVKSQMLSVPQFVNNGEFLNQSTLRSSFPCVAGPMLGRYAHVSDMYQTVASVAICETDGTTYYWRPQRTDYATMVSQSTGTLNLVPFVTSPVVILSAAPTGNMTVIPSAVNAWPGAQFRVIMPGIIGLPFGINISGLVGSSVITALQGRDYVLTYTAAGWKSN